MRRVAGDACAQISTGTKDGFMKLYIGNLPYNISDDQLSALFEKVGKPDSATVVMDRATGQSKGFGFVEFSNADQAKQALSLDGTDFGGRAIKVNEARPKNDSFGSRGGARY
jgi:RNA recognition motif-containing protein